MISAVNWSAPVSRGKYRHFYSTFSVCLDFEGKAFKAAKLPFQFACANKPANSGEVMQLKDRLVQKLKMRHYVAGGDRSLRRWQLISGL